MTDGEALYRAIVARPEDDTPRLVYADWLEENGHEEEAEFIRLECKLEASTPELPEYTRLMARRDELRLWLQAQAPKKLKKKLAGGLSICEGSNWWTDTRRGFPRFLTVEHHGGRLGAKGIRKLASALEKAFALIPTRWLVVGFSAVDDLAEFLKQPVVEALESLTISSVEQAGEETARIIANCKHLRNLRAADFGFPLEEAGAALLCRAENLGQLDSFRLDTFQLTPAAIHSLSSGKWFLELRQLSLQNGLPAETFEELCRHSFPHLHSLDLPDNSFPVSSWQTFAKAIAFPQLSRLVLRDNDMSNGQMVALAATDNFRLSSLDLARCSIGNEGVSALVAARWVGTLRWLDLSVNRLGPLAARTLAKCRQLANLNHLALAGNPIAGSGLEAIGQSPNFHHLITLLLGEYVVGPRKLLASACHTFLEKLNLPQLRHLSLSGLPLAASSLRLLAEERFQNLTRLELENCKLTDEAIPDLLHSLNLQGLIELNLKSNSLKTGAAPLTDRRIFPQLSKCNLTDNPISPELNKRLARRPGVVVSKK